MSISVINLILSTVILQIGSRLTYTVKAEDPNFKIICENIPSGTFLPHKDDCTRFMRCFMGKPFEFRCFHTYRWNPTTQSCVPANTTECILYSDYETAKLEKPMEETTAMPSATMETKDYDDLIGQSSTESDKPENGKVIEMKRENEANLVTKEAPSETLQTDDETPESLSLDTSKRESPCANMSDGTFLPHETDCKRFIKCSRGKPHEFYCPKTFIWDQSRLSCIFEDLVPCLVYADYDLQLLKNEKPFLPAPTPKTDASVPLTLENPTTPETTAVDLTPESTMPTALGTRSMETIILEPTTIPEKMTSTAPEPTTSITISTTPEQTTSTIISTTPESITSTTTSTTSTIISNIPVRTISRKTSITPQTTTSTTTSKTLERTTSTAASTTSEPTTLILSEATTSTTPEPTTSTTPEPTTLTILEPTISTTPEPTTSTTPEPTTSTNPEPTTSTITSYIPVRTISRKASIIPQTTTSTTTSKTLEITTSATASTTSEPTTLTMPEAPTSTAAEPTTLTTLQPSTSTRPEPTTSTTLEPIISTTTPESTTSTTPEPSTSTTPTATSTTSTITSNIPVLTISRKTSIIPQTTTSTTASETLERTTSTTTSTTPEPTPSTTPETTTSTTSTTLESTISLTPEPRTSTTPETTTSTTSTIPESTILIGKPSENVMNTQIVDTDVVKSIIGTLLYLARHPRGTDDLKELYIMYKPEVYNIYADRPFEPIGSSNKKVAIRTEALIEAKIDQMPKKKEFLNFVTTTPLYVMSANDDTDTDSNRSVYDVNLPQKDSRCSVDPLARLPASRCSQFYQCSDGYAFLLDCQHYYKFDSIYGKCVPDFARQCW
uniref:Chitin-binding type-2 domain-containing protein n=1 Tax=Glossina austeni TaxID=7395 RepID=A0A1A9UQP6_GLOAU